MVCSICRDEGFEARFCKCSWHGSNTVQPQATDESSFFDVEGLVSPCHQVETPHAPEIILPLTPPPPFNDIDRNEQMTDLTPAVNSNSCDVKSNEILDSQGPKDPENESTNVAPRPPMLLSRDIPPTENRFNVLMEPETDERTKNDVPIDESNKPNVLTNKSTDMTDSVVPSSPSVLSKRTPPYGAAQTGRCACCSFRSY